MNNKLGILEIDSQEIMSVLSSLEQFLNILQKDVKPIILSDFEGLKKTNLFSDGLENIIKQVELLTTNNQNMMTKIAVHMNEIIELEQQLSTEANDYESQYSGDNGEDSGIYFDFSDIVVNSVEQGNSIKNDDVIGLIPKLSETTQISLIKFLSMNKESNASLNDLLFDEGKSGLLLKLLKKFYGNDSEYNPIEPTDSSIIAQKELLKVLNKNDKIDTFLYNHKVLVAKNYLSNVAQENNITFENFITDDAYNDLFMSSIKNIYDENTTGKYKIDSSTIESVKATISSIAEKNNISVETLLSDSRYASLLKGLYL